MTDLPGGGLVRVGTTRVSAGGQGDLLVSNGQHWLTLAGGGRLPIDVMTMTDLDDHDDDGQVLNLVQDSVVPLSKTVSVEPRELFATRRLGSRDRDVILATIHRRSCLGRASISLAADALMKSL